jgi:hypothetical protein
MFATILGNFNLDRGSSRRCNAHVEVVLLTTISTTALSIGTSLTQLSSGDSGGLPTPGVTSTTSDASSTDGSDGSADPATYFTLSDQAKANLAATNRLDAYVNAYRNSGAATGGATNAVDSLLGFTPPTTSGSNSETTTLQIPVIANGNEPQPFQTFSPTQTISKTVTYDGYTLSLNADAGTKWYGIELNGNGVQAYDKHFGTSDQAAGASGVTPGTEVSSGIVNNNEALDEITVTRNTATASSASASSSTGASASTSSASAQSSSITFLVNYATGAISIEQSATSLSAQSSQSTLPGSIVSTRA